MTSKSKKNNSVELNNKNPWYKKGAVIAAIITSITLVIVTIFSQTPANKTFDTSNKSLTESETTPDFDDSVENTQKLNTVLTIPLSDYKSADSVFRQIREEEGLRELSALESGKSINDIPNKTVSFVSVYFLTITPHETFENILDSKVNRFKSGDSYYEIHKIESNIVYLCGFVGAETAYRFNLLDGEYLLDFVLTAVPLNDNDNLVLIPIERIVKSSRREIDIDRNRQLTLLDIQIN